MSNKNKNTPQGSQRGQLIGNSKAIAPGKITGEGEEEIMRFDTAGKMPPGKVVTESTKGDVRNHIKK